MFKIKKTGYLLIASGVLLIMLGFLIMGISNYNGQPLSEDEVYSFTRIRLAPFIIILGLSASILGIFIKPKKKGKK